MLYVSIDVAIVYWRLYLLVTKNITCESFRS